jgi:hypothetical protein
VEELRRRAVSVGGRIGAVLGFVVFLFAGLVPGFYFGSYAALMLLSKLYGGPVEPGLASRIVVVVGMALGVFCALSVCIIGGALLGSALGYLVAPRGAASERGKQQ